MRLAFCWPRARVLALVLLAACQDQKEPEPEPNDEENTASKVIGSAGGEVALGQARLVIPPGALSQDVTIRIIATGESAPANFLAFSKIYRFEPAGTRFALPPQVYLPFTGDESLATIYFSREAGSGFDAQATRVMGSVASTEVTYLGLAFVAALPGAWNQAQWNKSVWQ